MLNLEQVRQFLYYEARLLDDRQWDEWLSCYSPQVVYWMPAWGDDDQLTRDPQKEISLIYYPTAKGWRIASTALKPSAPGPARRSRGPPTSSATLSCWAKATRGWRCATAGSPGAIAISTRMPISALPAAR
jgi:benzoate/toluate 1,2-dioxygenase beta subunit